MKTLSKEHKKKIAEAIRQRHKQGLQPKVAKCNKCSAFLGKKHDCQEIWRKQSQIRLKNPLRYWLGKKRPEIGKILSKKFKGRASPWTTGKNSATWKGGSWDWWHEQARQVMEKHLGRELASTEIVHHINGDWHNNRLRNLVVTTRSEHIKIHKKRGDIL